MPTQWQLPRSWGSSEVELLQVGKGDVPPEQKKVFLAVQDSSIGDLVTQSVSERFLTFGRLLGDFWETFERQRQRQRQKSDLDSLRNSCDAYIYLFHCFGFVFVYMFSCLDLIKKIMGDCIITLRGKVFAFDLFYFIPSFCSIFRSSPGWVFPCNLILLSS